ncbi:MAG: RNA polymerase sigma factor [Clostridium sp.]|nr:RNA polymerase sigma factor [Clostridium sp.]
MNYSEKDFISTYNCYVDMIYRLCFSFLKNKEDTEDAVQSVFMKYIKKAKKFENENHKKAWFVVASSNVCKDMLRQSCRRNISIESFDTIPNVENPATNEVYLAILDLPYKYKTVVYLYYYEGYKTYEIAKILHKPSSTIRNYLTEARRYLKKILGGVS